MRKQLSFQFENKAELREYERERERERESNANCANADKSCENIGGIDDNPHNSWFTFQNLLKAYYQCRKTKRKSQSAAKFELNFEQELLKLETKLKNKTYKPGKYTCFAVSEPKIREVWAADFCDRILHHLLVIRIEPIWEKKFIFHSYACRKEKGAHRAVRKLKNLLYRPPTSFARTLHFLQIDIESFFMSIDKEILLNLIKKHVKNPEILWLARTIIFQDPSENFTIKGDKNLLKSIPKHKSLFHVSKNKGLPIGNYTSQFFANVYLNEVDQFVKHQLKCRHYFRYMDDLLLLHPDKQKLKNWRDEISKFLQKNLKLKLHPKKQTLRPVGQGIDFLGYIVKPDYSLVRKRTVKKLKNNLKDFNRKFTRALERKNLTSDDIFHDRFLIFDSQKTTADFWHIFSSINSTFGSLKHANCRNLRQTLYEKHFGILKIYLRPANKNYDYFTWDEE